MSRHIPQSSLDSPTFEARQFAFAADESDHTDRADPLTLRQAVDHHSAALTAYTADVWGDLVRDSRFIAAFDKGDHAELGRITAEYLSASLDSLNADLYDAEGA